MSCSERGAGWVASAGNNVSEAARAASVPRRLSIPARVGDRFTDETGAWEVIRLPFTTAAGKNVHASVQKIGQAQLTDLRTWTAHEHVSVKRA